MSTSESIATAEANTLLQRVNNCAFGMGESGASLEHGFAALGYMLLQVAEYQYWRLKHETFKEYLKTVAEHAGCTTSQLQRYFLTVRDLIDILDPKQIESMGITKAMKLRQAKDYAIIFPQAVLDVALDPKSTAADLKKIIAEKLKMPEEDGDWMDCEMEFMVTPEQRKTIELAIQAAMHTDPVTKSNISKSAQMLDVMMKFAEEFLGAHSEVLPE